MIDTLVGLFVVVIIVGVVLFLAKILIDMIPMDSRFKQLAWVLVLLVAILIVLSKALPLLGVSL